MATPDEFVQQYGPSAARAARTLGVDPSILLGQFGLETGWGRSVVPGTNNLGNIKDFSGGGVAARDNMTGSADRYRQYATPDAFMDDYVNLIQQKYPQAVGVGNDAVKFARALKFGGYAEDPAYIPKVAGAASTVRRLGDKLTSFLFPSAQAGELPANRFDDIFADMPKPAAQAPAAEPAPAPTAPGAAPRQAAPAGADPFADIFADAPAAKPATPTPAKQPVPAVKPERAAVQQVGDALMDIPRQVGLTARYGMEGLGRAVGLFTEPLRRVVVNPALRALGLPEAVPAEELASRGASGLGLPQPTNANERVVGDIARSMAGAGGLAGTSNALARGATGVTRTVLQTLGSNPGQQIASAAGAGGAGGSVREAGGGEGAQAIASLIGGLAAPLATQQGTRAVSSVANRLSPPSTQEVEQQIRLVMDRSGVDWGAVPERVRQMVREEAGQALRTGGDLSGDALRRLVDFGRVQGATPTRGMLTLDPVQITRERNLAKIGANASDEGLQGLARVQNSNNSALIGALNNAGANTADDAYAAGQRVIDALQRNVDTQRGNINNLYSAARDSAGRSFPLDGAAFTQRASQALDDALLGGALPADVRNHLNRIAQGEVPFTVDYAEQLKTRIGNLQRASQDGQTRMALGVVRRALDDTPVLGLGQQTGAAGARAVNPGNLPAIPRVPDLGEQAVEAFNQARSANRSFMQQVENTPALQAVYDGTATPDQFMQRYLIGSAAKARDVEAMRTAIAADPAVGDTIRAHIASWLKGRALNGAADEVGNFSASNYNKALQAIGGQKLAAFFSPDEIEQLRAIGRVGSYMAHQPVGSAVNNSNSGALVLGRGMDFLNAVASRSLPLGIGTTIVGAIRGAYQNGAGSAASAAAQRVPPALVQPTAVNQAARALRWTSPVAYSALFPAAGIPPSQDDGRR
ncbi:glucosaminidase domain-containing protein [Herbaspirillum chlorophenolicum]|nr:glucosaminidase domain-containing protein [Herbaspirillum chlorophenolicum]